MGIGVLRGGVLAGEAAGAGVAGSGASGFGGFGAGAPGGGAPDLPAPGVAALGVGVGGPGFGALGTGVAALGVLGTGVTGAGVAGLAGGGVCAVPGSAARSVGRNVAQPKSAEIATLTLVCFLKKGIMGVLPGEWGCRGFRQVSVLNWGLVLSIIDDPGANRLGNWNRFILH